MIDSQPSVVAVGLLLLAGCTSPRAGSGATDPSATGAASPATASPSTSVKPAAAGPCTASLSTDLDIGVALDDEACTVELADGASISPVSSEVTIEAVPEQPRVVSGRSVVLRVVLHNEGASAVTVDLDRAAKVSGEWSEQVEDSFSGFGGGLPEGMGTASGAPAPAPKPAPAKPPATPERGATPGFVVEDALDAKSRSTAPPVRELGMKGLLGSKPKLRVTRVVLPPATKAHATVLWTATGYDPDKKYGRQSDGRAPPPDPLHPGKYRLRIVTPARRAGGAVAKVSAELTVTR